jgi:hypothetical protein
MVFANDDRYNDVFNLDEVIQLIKDCFHRKHKLTEYEREFISTLTNKKPSQLSNITKKQLLLLEKIWEKATA